MPPLTKASFLDAMTCPTKGWYHQHLGESIPDWDLRWRFFQGQEIHRLAAEWCGGGIPLPRAPLDAALEATRQAMASPQSDQYFEATFATDLAVARADKIRCEVGGWAIVEVKSGKSPAPGDPPSEEYLDDLSYTVMVAQAAGVPVVAAQLVLVNRDYRLGMPDSTRFELLDVTDEVLARAAKFAAVLPELAARAGGDQRPAPVLNPACKSCDYFEAHCLGREIPDPVFLLPRLSGKRFEALAEFGSIARVPADADLTDNQRVVFELLRSGEPRTNLDELRKLDEVTWPARYLDFETVMPALPWHEGDGPYTTLLTQYSLHVLDAPGGTLGHQEYLTDLEGDWRRDLVERLLETLGDRGSVVVYSSYEMMRLREAAERFPDLAAPLEAVISRLFDLEPFFKKGYLHPGFRGRSSIKATLPVLVPELSYDGLPVGNGGDAAGLVALMKRGVVPEAEHPRHRRDLLEYCKLDTLAMVRLHQALLELRG